MLAVRLPLPPHDLMLPTLRTIAVDDEPLALSGLVSLLASDVEVAVVAQCSSGQDAERAIRTLAPDLLFLDVQMPELDGFEVIRRIGPERMPPVVFVTAHDRFALQAFDVSAVDYLLKPFDDDRFAMALARAKRAARRESIGAVSAQLRVLLDSVSQAGTPASPNGAAAPQWAHRLLLRETGRAELIATEDIDWIEGASYYVKVHGAGRTRLLRETLTSLAARLDPARFVRVHRSAIVNLSRVMELRVSGRGSHQLVMQDGTRLRVSRDRRVVLERALGGTR